MQSLEHSLVSACIHSACRLLCGTSGHVPGHERLERHKPSAVASGTASHQPHRIHIVRYAGP
ncbi:hypothetical protein EJ03DRAFT_329184 [Teratosphaeria nubilosa]|uniref:Uncharacterized protein n=1 Tax=Teratosphaeria nubilosa TaxID=161662 RepID=A0A6G1L3Z0_9PEZI|nr:hypothetical protein EJ03DRAFT_329184 [Teratosphaeria nubilosa]